jgi:hypothetical protein
MQNGGELLEVVPLIQMEKNRAEGVRASCAPVLNYCNFNS